MQRHACLRAFCLGVLCAALSVTMPPADVIAAPGHKYGQGGKNDQGEKNDNHRQHRQREERGDRNPRKSDGQKQHRQFEDRSDRNPRKNDGHMSARHAAGQAQQRYGGQVLKVDPQGSGFNVRLLQDDGRVITVFIGD